MSFISRPEPVSMDRPMTTSRFMRTLSNEALNEYAKNDNVYGKAASQELYRRSKKNSKRAQKAGA